MAVPIPAPLPGDEERDDRARSEFRHRLVRDGEQQQTWHLLYELDPERKKPVPTGDGLPDRKSWSWGEFWPDLTDTTPIEIEIGSGKGNFLAEYCQKRPEVRLVAVEIEAKYAKYAGGRLERNGIPNGISLRGDALLFLRDYVPSDSLSAFHMYQPDPWPKEQHRRRRLLRPEFLAEIFRTARPGGESLFYWSTDFAEYDERAQEMFVETPFLKLISAEAKPTYGIMTNFEKKYRKEGRPIYRSVVRIVK